MTEGMLAKPLHKSIQIKSYSDIEFATHERTPYARRIEFGRIWRVCGDNRIFLNVIAYIFASDIEVPMFDSTADLGIEHRVYLAVFRIAQHACLRRYAAATVELRRKVEDPFAQIGGVLYVEQRLELPDKRSLNECACAVGTIDRIFAVGPTEGGENIQPLDGIPCQIDLIGIGERTTIGAVNVNAVRIKLLVGNDAVEELRAEIVETYGHIAIAHGREGLRERASCRQSLLHAVESATVAVVEDYAATRGEDADVVGNDIGRTIAQACRTAQHG